ncbi:MAG: hypothetical protein HQM14_09965 [SAR324 cluster bacterium]|nr:hypothetical protein [SAR324 cluster bacterium]
MKKLLKILLIHSFKDLLRYKSFLFLIFFIFLADRILHHYVQVDRSSLQLDYLKELGLQAAPFVFEELPGLFAQWLLELRTLLVIMGLFLLKQLISMWPSSDMRKMHRQERGKFGLWDSFCYLRWYQFLWDAIAVGSICGVLFVWAGVGFVICRQGWLSSPSPLWLIVLGGVVFLSTPIAMAGFSYSSKLAVLSQGSFAMRLSLFFKLLTDWNIFWKSWLFYLTRIIVEGIFVAIIPAGLILTLDNFWIRLFLAGLSATPVYSYVKMVSFKFFIEIYRDDPLVQHEYKDYLTIRSSTT